MPSRVVCDSTESAIENIINVLEKEGYRPIGITGIRYEEYSKTLLCILLHKKQ